jgi:Ran GTPase-activating protein (RanGAP) involved in mRNA processing and transport
MSVTAIDLTENEIGADGASALADALKVNTSIRTIDLESNSIDTKGAIALADAFTVTTSVTKLIPAHNEIFDEGASALADALSVNASVTEINISCTEIDNEGASALADALVVNTSVTTINLSDNVFDAKGVFALAAALKVNTSVTTIDLDTMFIKFDGADDLEEYEEAFKLIDDLIARNNRLRRLFIFDARKMLFSLMTGCADEVSVVLPYALSAVDANVIISAADVEPLRAEFAAVVEERRCRAIAALQ